MEKKTFSNYGHCISCKIAGQVIRDFFTVMEDGLEIHTEEWKALFQFIGKPMSSAQQDMDYLNKMFTSPTVKERRMMIGEKVNEFCISNLQDIIFTLYRLRYSAENDRFSRQSNMIFRQICESLGNDKYARFSEWKKIILAYEEGDYEGNTVQKAKLEKQAKRYLDKIESIIDDYIYSDREYEIEGDCFMLTMNQFLNEAQESHELSKELCELADRIDKLKEPYHKITLQFIKKIPKNFGRILTDIMDSKEMTEQNIVNFLPKDFRITTSNIQSLKQCKVPSIDKDIITCIARCLLVDESVLYYGYGFSYGNWMDLIPTSVSKDLQKVTAQKTLTEIRQAFISEIAEIIASPGFYENIINNIETQPIIQLQKEEVKIFGSLKEQIQFCNDISSIYNLVDTLEEIESEYL